MNSKKLQGILNFIQNSKNDLYQEYELENDEIEILMPSIVKHLLMWHNNNEYYESLKESRLFNLKLNNHFSRNEIAVYHNGMRNIPIKILILDLD